VGKPTLGYKNTTNPFSPAKPPTSTSSPSLSINVIFGSLSPNFIAPFPPVSGFADFGASASFSAAAVADVSSGLDLGASVGLAEVGLAFLDAGPDFGLESAGLYRSREHPVPSGSSVRGKGGRTLLVDPGLVSSALASGAASSAIREDLREEEGGGAVEAGFFGGIFTSARKVSCDDDGGADEWRKEDAGFSVSYRRSSFWGPRSGTRSLVTFARFPIVSLICFDE